MVKELSSIAPDSLYDLIYSKSHWKSQELANLISPKLSIEAAKLALKLCHYKWDVKKQAYAITEEAQQILDKLSKDVNWRAVQREFDLDHWKKKRGRK